MVTGTARDQELRRGDRLAHWAGLVLVILGACAIAIFGLGSDADEKLRLVRDSLQPRQATGQIAIVEIDARSLAAVSTWPWPRSRHGEMAEKLRKLGASTIAFDIDFSSYSRPEEDAAFAASLKRVGGDVILPTFVQPTSSLATETSENLPIDALRDHAFTGSVNVQPDRDGQLRNYTYGVVTGGIPRPSIGALLAGGGSGAVGESFRIDASIDPATIPRISAINLLSGRVPRASVAGKSIVIGATAVETADRYIVPGHGVMPGVVAQALAAETLVQGTVNRDFGPWAPLGLAALVVLICAARPGRRINIGVIAAGIIAILFLPLGLEHAKLGSVAIVPALVLVALYGSWSALLRLHRKIRDDRLTDAATGLPNAKALTANRERAGHIVVARIQQWTELKAVLSPVERQLLVTQIIARLETAFPDARLHFVESATLGWATSEAAMDRLTDAIEGACALFRLPIGVDSRSLLVTPVFGIQHAQVGRSKALPQALLAAERAIENGQRWGVHSEQAMSRTDRALMLLGDIDGALASGDIFVLYQPKYDLAQARIAGAEALVRWRHPVLGAVSPDEFIPLLENSGHIAPLTFTVLDRCIADLAQWSTDGHDLGVAVNISAALLDDHAFTTALAKRLAATGPLATKITLEITESATLDGAASAIAALEAIRALGTRVSIDDYGTGRATLSYLKSFPTDEIKIDRSFVTAIEANASDRILVRSTIELAHELGFTVVAEGVEDIACLDLLRSYHCDTAQGWAIGRPMPAAELLTRVTEPPALSAAA